MKNHKLLYMLTRKSTILISTIQSKNTELQHLGTVTFDNDIDLHPKKQLSNIIHFKIFNHRFMCK